MDNESHQMDDDDDDDDDDVFYVQSQPQESYSNTAYTFNDEQTDVTSSTAGVADYGSRATREVQFQVDDQSSTRQTRPQLITVVTTKPKPTLFDKKFGGKLAILPDQ